MWQWWWTAAWPQVWPNLLAELVWMVMASPLAWLYHRWLKRHLEHTALKVHEKAREEYQAHLVELRDLVARLEGLGYSVRPAEEAPPCP